MNQKLSFRSRQEIDKATWDDFVIKSDMCWLWHDNDFINSFESWPNQTDVSVAITDKNDKILGLLPLHESIQRRKKILRQKSLFSLGGLALKNGLSEKRQRKIRNFVYETLSSNAAKNGYNNLSITLSPMTPFLWSKNAPHINPLVLDGFENTLTQSWIIDLSLSQKSIDQSMSETTRQQLKKVQESGITIRPATLKDLDTYYTLHQETYNRTDMKPHPYEYFEGIFTKLLKDKKVQILLASDKDQIIAAKNCARFKEGVYYWTGASKTGVDSSINKLLMHEQIKSAKRDGFLRYECGESFPGTTNNKKAGLSLYKGSFGGQLYPFYRGQKGFTSRSFGL